MAEYGLTVKNSGGYLVIDGTYSNMGIRQSGALDMSDASQLPNGCYYKSFTFSASSPILALAGDYALVSSISLSNGVLTAVIQAQSKSTLTYYLFDEAAYGARYNTAYGLVVKNKTTGVVVFDSRIKYMRVIDVIQGDPGSNGGVSISRSYAGVASVAVVQCTRYRYGTTVVIPGGNPPQTQPIGAASASKAVGASVNIAVITLFTYPPATNNPTFNDDQPFYSYLVLDVSNY